MNNGFEQVKIKSIFISNFRSFAPRNKEADGMNVDDLSTINIFVGPNGSGKTNFFNALRICNDLGPFNSMGTCFYKYNSHKGVTGVPTEVTIRVEISNTVIEISYLYRDNQPVKFDFSLRERIYPIGLPHKFSEFNEIHKKEIKENKPEQNKTYTRICHSWEKIRNDAKRVGITLQESYPKEPVVNGNKKDNEDRFFYDVVDDYGVPVLEGSDGIASYLLMIVKIRIREPGSVILIEEPEVNMHPRLQKQFLDYLKYLVEEDKYQFLVNTHSPYLLNFAVYDKTEDIAVFRISKDKSRTQIKPVKNKKAENWEILTDLGHSPADVLQASCVIWVEGPSDRIYLNHWLEAYDDKLKEGLHYSIMFYGGRLLSHLSFDNDDDVDEFIALRRINQNSAILIDSDREKEGQKLAPTKSRVCKEFSDGPGFAWISAGREIENYIPPKLMEKAVKNVNRNAIKLVHSGRYDQCYHFIDGSGKVHENIKKVKIAKQVSGFDAELDRFDLRKRVRNLADFIRQCND